MAVTDQQTTFLVMPDHFSYMAECSKHLVVKATGLLPSPKRPGDVGYDIPAAGSYVIRPGQFVKIRTGVKIEMPEGIWASVEPRSNANFSGKLIVLSGTIDTGFRGEMIAVVHHVTQSVWTRVWAWLRRKDLNVYLNEGDSIAQLIFHPAITPQVMYTDELSPSERGTNGFGSTGNGVKHSN